MKGTVLYAPRDIRFEARETPKILKPTDAIIRTSATCVCGSDLWPYRGIEPITEPTPMGHEYVGVVEQVGSEVHTVKVGDHVVIHASKKNDNLIAATVQVGMGKMAGMKMDGNSSSASPQPK